MSSTIGAKLFHFLIKTNVEYCVVGDVRKFPEVIDSDIDIIISKNILPNIKKIVYEFCKQYDTHLVQILQHEQTGFYYILTFIQDGQRVYLHPDFCSDYFRNGRLLLSAEEILNNRKLALDEKGESKGFYVPAPAYAFIYYLLKRIDKLHLTSEQGAYLSQQWHLQPDSARTLVRRFWGNQNSLLIENAADSNNWKTLNNFLPVLQKELHKTTSQIFVHRLKEWVRIIHRIFSPTGLFVIFLGADGSGKSSVIDKIIYSLKPAFRRTEKFHFRPLVGLRQSKGKNKSVEEPHKYPPYGSVKSMLKLLYYSLDYIVGYIIYIKPVLMRSTLVVFDRYYYDLLIDPKRFRLRRVSWVAKLIGIFIPKPDVVVLLDAPAEVLQARKQEVSFEETEFQRIKYRTLVQKWKNGYVVDASQPLQNVIRDTEGILCNYLAKRVKKRLGENEY